VNLQGENFVGKQALKEEQSGGQKWVLRTVQIDCIEGQIEAAKLYDHLGGPLYATIGGKLTEIGAINCHAWSWGLQKIIGNASIYARYKDLTEAVFLANDIEYRVQLLNGAHISLERRTQLPARIEK